MTFEEEREIKLRIMLREKLEEFPDYVGDFTRGLTKATTNTKVAYLVDLRVFYRFLEEKILLKPINNITLGDLEQVSARDIEIFLEFIGGYNKEDYTDKTIITNTNNQRGKARKLATLRSFYNYFYKRERISNNPILIVDPPKIDDHNIVHLEPNETANLLDIIETGRGLTPKQLLSHSKVKTRDLAMVSLMLSTGIRVSECIGINLEDIDFNNNAVAITRKGKDKSIVYFGNEAEKALLEYIYERNIKENKDHLKERDINNPKPLFVTHKGTRIAVRTVQDMVKKYSSLAVPLKNITPHKLRSTFGTTVYQETGDIYLVADVLGHKDVNTTKKHYAKQQESKKREISKLVRLRDA